MLIVGVFMAIVWFAIVVVYLFLCCFSTLLIFLIVTISPYIFILSIFCLIIGFLTREFLDKKMGNKVLKIGTVLMVIFIMASIFYISSMILIS